MDTRYLKSLIAVVDCGSIAKAARLENLTAAAISQRIVALERQLGMALLVRVGHEAKPSLACMDLLPRARAIVNEVALLAGDADSHGLTGPLRIGAISTVLTGLLPQALRALTRSTPQLKPVIVPGLVQTNRDSGARSFGFCRTSRTDRPYQPNVSKLGASGLTPSRETSPWDGLNAYNPQYEAGLSNEPAVCVPSASANKPAAIPAAEPALELPGVLRRSWGLRVGPVFM